MTVWRMASLSKKTLLARRIKKRLRAHLRALGFVQHRTGKVSPRQTTKSAYRALHRGQRSERLRSERAFVKRAWPVLGHHFADGCEVDPSKILPTLEIVHANTWQSDLFRLAALTWSVPVSQGFGRRIRFLVWDQNNGKLMGLIAIGDPVFNLRVRDKHIGWSTRYRQSRLINMMDAYVLGAMPPYNLLLGGKLVACLIRTREVRDAFRSKYAESRGIISRRKKDPHLVAVTTTSALGPSAVFDRLKLGGLQFFKPIGFTEGWGHFHIPPDLFEMTREYLRLSGHRYAEGHRYGNGPNWKLRVVRQAFVMLNLNDDALNHGISREVFFCPLATNAIEVLAKRNRRAPSYANLQSVEDVGKLAVQRWMVRRGNTRPEFVSWKREDVARLAGVPRSILAVRSVQHRPQSAIREAGVQMQSAAMKAPARRFEPAIPA